MKRSSASRPSEYGERPAKVAATGGAQAAGPSFASPSGAALPISSSGSSAATQHAVRKRTDYLAWDDYFLSVAFLSAQRSKDPSTQVGACIVDPDNRIVGIGYNGFPRGCDDDSLPWGREIPRGGSELDTKYPFVCHAEMNAILNKNQASIKECRMYVALFPCNECAKLIIQSGIKEVIFYSDKHHAKSPFVASRKLLDLAGVTYRQHTPKHAQVVIDFAAIG